MAQSATNNTQMAPAPQHTQIQQQPQKLSFSQVINTNKFQRLLMNSLGDEKVVKEFTSSVINAVNKTPAIQDCTPASIVGAALNGHVMKLPPAPQLGFFYMVPFKQKEKKKNGVVIQPECMKAEFVMGYRGFINLALRTGQYKKINVLEIKEGEFQSFDPLNEVIKCMMITDPEKRTKAPTVGYYAMFELLNGFTKAMYWSKEQMLIHADTFSSAFSATAYKKLQNGEIPQDEMWKYSSFWYKNFDEMGKKTMIRQIIGHWGPMTIEFQNAFVSDGQIIEVDDDGNVIQKDESAFVADQPQIVDVEEQVDLESL